MCKCILGSQCQPRWCKAQEIDFNHALQPRPFLRCRVILHPARDGVLCIALQCFIIVSSLPGSPLCYNVQHSRWPKLGTGRYCRVLSNRGFKRQPLVCCGNSSGAYSSSFGPTGELQYNQYLIYKRLPRDITIPGNSYLDWRHCTPPSQGRRFLIHHWLASGTTSVADRTVQPLILVAPS